MIYYSISRNLVAQSMTRVYWKKLNEMEINKLGLAIVRSIA